MRKFKKPFSSSFRRNLSSRRASQRPSMLESLLTFDVGTLFNSEGEISIPHDMEYLGKYSGGPGQTFCHIYGVLELFDAFSAPVGTYSRQEARKEQQDAKDIVQTLNEELTARLHSSSRDDEGYWYVFDIDDYRNGLYLVLEECALDV